MVNRGYVVLGVLVLTGLAITLVSGHRSWSGPELFEVSETHGVNLGDVPVLAAWSAGTGYFLWLLRRR